MVVRGLSLLMSCLVHAVGGGNAPMSWMPTAVIQEEEEEEGWLPHRDVCFLSNLPLFFLSSILSLCLFITTTPPLPPPLLFHGLPVNSRGPPSFAFSNRRSTIEVTLQLIFTDQSVVPNKTMTEITLQQAIADSTVTLDIFSTQH